MTSAVQGALEMIATAQGIDVETAEQAMIAQMGGIPLGRPGDARLNVVSSREAGGDLMEAILASRQEDDVNAAGRHLAANSSPIPDDALVTSAHGP